MLRAFLAACAVGVIALTLILGVRHRPTVVVVLPAPPPLAGSVAAPVLTAPPHVQARVVTRPRTIVAKQHPVRLAPVAEPQFAAQVGPAKRTPSVPAPPAAKPALPPATNTPAPPTTTPTSPAAPSTPSTPVTPTPAPPNVTPTSPPVDTTPSAPTSQPLESPPETTPPTTTVTPPVVTPPVAPPPAPSPADTRPGNGWGDKNHVHTGPPGHGNG